MRKSFMVEFTGTPEAGKTTCIANIANKFSSMGYKVAILKESAEDLPGDIPKGTWDANLWMHYHTIAGIIKSKYLDADIILIDRGLEDSKFYGRKYLKEGICTIDEYERFNLQFLDNLFPNLVIGLTVDTETAIQRRGGEGRLVNRVYLNRYNEIFLEYFDEIQGTKVLIDTSKSSIYEMNNMIFNIIKPKLE